MGKVLRFLLRAIRKADTLIRLFATLRDLTCPLPSNNRTRRTPADARAVPGQANSHRRRPLRAVASSLMTSSAVDPVSGFASRIRTLFGIGPRS